MAENLSAQDLASLLRFDKRGLVVCVAQDWRSGEVLLVAYMNREAFTRTLDSGHLHLFSRSRQALWEKGETSGNRMALKGLRVDCDGDALLALVEPLGPACHTGERSCFFRGSVAPAAPFEVLPALERTVAQRAREAPPGSYTVSLLADPKRPAEKVVEEAGEVVKAARAESAARLSEEAADLLYHLLVLLRSRELSLEGALEVLDGRRR